ncbi:MAG: sporulation protein YunB [Clostridiales bacterium]|nr:sporulation protein YunB [Clostridiales bacterium]
MLYRRHRKKRLVRLKRAIFSLIAAAAAIVIFCEYHLSDFRPEYIRAQAEILSVNSVCDAVNDSLENLNYSYDDIAKVNYSDDGTIQSITTDSFKINTLKSSVTKAVQNEIAKIYDNEIEIPLGAFTNITVLSNAGPCICMNFNLTGSFSSEIVSTFESAGVNQTIHHIRLLLTSKIMTTSLDYSGNMTFTTDFEIAQTVIVGTVPSTYGTLYKTY